jgi:hypothetical protein
MSVFYVQEVLTRMASGAAAAGVLSIKEEPQLWPAHIVSSSMALTTDSKHRPQDLRVAVGTTSAGSVHAAVGLGAAAAAAGCVVVQDVDMADVQNVHAEAAAADSERMYNVCTEEAGLTESDGALGHANAVAGAVSWPMQAIAAAAGATVGADSASDWKTRLYLGCVIAAEMRAAVARETGYR